MGNFSGVMAPIVTPFADDGSIVGDLWVAHAKWVLAQGADYLVPFGTTGEALSVSMSARMLALEMLVDAGIPPNVLLPGTGLTSLADTSELTRHATDLGVAACMILPSFFFKAASQEGQFRYFTSLAEAVTGGQLKVFLYNIPQNSGVVISPTLAARLNSEFPEIFVGFKDSTGDWQSTQAIIHAAPDLAVFPGTEGLMTDAMQIGGAGCISASVNLNAGAIRRVFEMQFAGQDTTELNTQINRFREIIGQGGLIPSLKSVLAVQYQDERWLNLLPPLENGSFELGRAVLNELGPLGTHLHDIK